MNKTNLYILCILALTSCGKNRSSQTVEVMTGKIIGGVEVLEATMYSKHTVGIFNDKINTVCTGIIIEKNLILTAAHCVYKTPAAKVQIVFGEKILERGANKMIASGVIVHEGYNEKMIINDLALVRLPQNASDNYSPVDLEESRQLILAKGTMVTTIGYGITSTGFFSSVTRGTLRMGKIAIDDYENQKALVTIDQTKGAAICFGDSGGPTFTNVNDHAVLVGVTSFVHSPRAQKKFLCSSKAYLSNPNFFYSWIQDSKLKI